MRHKGVWRGFKVFQKIYEVPKEIWISVNINVVGMRISTQMEKAINDQIAYEASAIQCICCNDIMV